MMSCFNVWFRIEIPGHSSEGVMLTLAKPMLVMALELDTVVNREGTQSFSTVCCQTARLPAAVTGLSDKVCFNFRNDLIPSF